MTGDEVADDMCILRTTHSENIRDMDCMKRKFGKYFDEDFMPLLPSHFNQSDDDVCDLHICNSSSAHLRDTMPDEFRGHLLPFGKQGQPTEDVEEIEGCISGERFLTDYVFRYKPVILRNCYKGVPKEKWGDREHLRKVSSPKFTPIVEAQKTVKRNDRGPFFVDKTFHNFLDNYLQKSWYITGTHSSDQGMRQEFVMPELMRCKRTIQSLEAYAMWMSSGGTESSQHFDTHDNLMIQVQGTKTLLLTSPEHSKFLYMVHVGFGTFQLFI